MTTYTFISYNTCELKLQMMGKRGPSHLTLGERMKISENQMIYSETYYIQKHQHRI